jgi:preprotein translocase subunit YajC
MTGGKMRTKKFFIFSLVLVLILALTVSFIEAAPQKKDQKKDQKVKSIIPKDIKTILEQGLPARQVKADLPFQFSDLYILPAKGSYIAIFITKIKNVDLNYAQPVGNQDLYQSDVEMFIQFYQAGGETPNLLAEQRTAGSFTISAADYQPEGESYYYLGYPLPAGKYTLAAALGHTATKKLGTTYYDFEIPNFEEAAQANKLETTSLFLLKDIQQMDTQENYPNFHKDYFSWIIFKAYPCQDNKLKPGDQPNLMFMIYGAKIDENQKADLEINFDIRKDNNKIVAFTPMKYDSPFIEQGIPVPATKKVQIKDDKGERIEDQPLEPGAYELVLNIKDNRSGLTLEKRIPFELIVQ